MDDDIDHYAILGLPSGEEGAKLTEKEIITAYRKKALELHPDKRPDDPNAPAEFQRLQTSYRILIDEKGRRLFDELIRVKRDKLRRQSQEDPKRRRMKADLEERERYAAAAQDYSAKAKSEEEIILRKFKEEVSRIRAMHASKFAPAAPTEKEREVGEKSSMGLSTEEKERSLKVSWEKGGVDYSAQRLWELFEKFGEVKDVVIRTKKKTRSALIVMGTKEAAVAATGTMCGDISNPLLVVPLQPAVATFSAAREPVVAPQADEEFVGAGYKAFEESVLEKIKKAAEKQKESNKRKE